MFQLLDLSKKKCDFDKICDLALKELDIAKDGRISKSNACLLFFKKSYRIFCVHDLDNSSSLSNKFLTRCWEKK